MPPRPEFSSEKVASQVSFVPWRRGLLTHAIMLHMVLGRAEERVAKLVDSPDKPESEASYKLDEGGWADV